MDFLFVCFLFVCLFYSQDVEQLCVSALIATHCKKKLV